MVEYKGSYKKEAWQGLEGDYKGCIVPNNDFAILHSLMWKIIPNQTID